MPTIICYHIFFVCVEPTVRLSNINLMDKNLIETLMRETSKSKETSVPRAAAT